MVTNNQEGLEGKDEVIIVREGKIITNPRMTLTVIDRIIMLLRTKKQKLLSTNIGSLPLNWGILH
jgi:hypothetical protein